ncbi:MAG: ABC transporter substrate-binding protein [Gammaproteobacteria bacterium]|nr:ABC transporter substrate-binding protein [Gammaproteobacteria bacterium]
MKLKQLFLGLVTVGLACSAFLTFALAEETMRLEWVMQGQFAGPIVALERGYYNDEGIEMKLLPAGPDIKPAVTVAQETDTFGIGHPNQVIAARANDVPLVMVMQFGQKSATTYVVRKEAGVGKVEDMAGHSVGLWFGGDEHEFLAMLDSAGVDQGDVKIISQGYDIVGWLNGDYEVMQVTLFNELLQVYDQGFKKSDLVFLDPSDYGVALVSGGVFTTQSMINENPAAVQAMVNATLRGWKEALAEPEAAAKIVVKYNSELDEAQQVAQIKAMGDLICAGPTLEGKFGMSTMESWETSQEVLLGAKLIENGIDLSTGFTNQFWEAAPDEYKTVHCGG